MYWCYLNQQSETRLHLKWPSTLVSTRHPFAFILKGQFATFFPDMQSQPTILTNMAFHNDIWRAATQSICQGDENPDRLPAWVQVWRLLRLRKKFDVVVTMGARISLFYGGFCAFLGLDSKQVMTEVFLDEKRPFSPFWRLKTALFRLISRKSIGILTNSSPEIGFIARRFSVSAEKLRFVPLYSTIAHPEQVETHAGNVVSIGRTRRDLATLVRAAPEISTDIIVVTDQAERMPSVLPNNVKILRNIAIAEAHALLRRAAVVVVPLVPAERSTGQVVMFEAMALGKPVVATRTTGTVDYIRDGENGLLVAAGDAAALVAAINRLLTDSELANRLGHNALDLCRTDWTATTHAQNKLRAITELWLKRNEHHAITPAQIGQER